ncbi:MAG: DUF2975 domain-containing protein [Steroidobacteraceae bacterium]
MPNDKRLFAVTQWTLKAAVIGTTLLIAVLICGAVAIIVAWHSGFLSQQLVRASKEIGEVTLSVGSMHAALNPLTDITAADVAKIALTALAGAVIVILLAQFILRAILRIVVSTSVGDPFIEKNATDIAHVAWLWLGVQAAEMLTKLAVYGVAPAAVRAKLGDPVAIPLMGLFAALLIFVLARIFRRGTEMRAELEATV